MLSNAGTQLRKTIPRLEWQVCEDEATWDAAQRAFWSPQVVPTPTRISLLWHRCQRYALVLGLLVVLSVGWWTWRRAEAGIAQVETELETEVVAELWQDNQAAHKTGAAGTNDLDKLALPADPGELITDVKLRGLGEDWAVADVTIQPAADGPTYRQTRVYRSDAYGWQRTSATAAQWGKARRLESQYFTFIYHDPDEEAVKQAAPRLDALYPQLLRDLYGSSTAHQKLTITLSPIAVAGQIDPDGSPQPGLVLLSPASALLPSDLSGEDMLLQSMVLALLDRQAINAFPIRIRPDQWFRIHNAYRLWFIWDHELPLAAWHKPLLQWALEDAGERRDPYDIPPFARELCAHHSLWMRAPLEISIPVVCWQRADGKEHMAAWRFHEVMPYLALDRLLYASGAVYDVSVYDDAPLSEPGPGAMMIASVFEYVSATYGKGKLPLLLAKIPQHERTATLIPAVFGVPLSEFERGWHAFLVERYGLQE